MLLGRVANLVAALELDEAVGQQLLRLVVARLANITHSVRAVGLNVSNTHGVT
jgi:hypothetical protein